MGLETVDKVRSVLAGLPEQSLVFLDVDDTLITPSSKVFRATSPYRTLIDDLKAEPELYPNFEQILSTWRVQRKPRLVSEKWPEVLTELQQKHKVYALTKMETGPLGIIPSMEEWRHQELGGLGLTFTPLFGETTQTVMLESSETHPYPATFYKGLFITGSHTKGEVLLSFLEKSGTPPYVVLIDDREEYLEDVRRVCEQHQIPFQGLLFEGVKLIPGEPNLKAAEFQRKRLLEQGEWWEDEAAEQYCLK